MPLPAARRSLSIELKLPLAIGALWLLAIAAVSGIAYGYVVRAGREAAAAHLHAVAAQFSDILATEAQNTIASARTIAGDSAVARYLAHPDDARAETAVRQALQSRGLTPTRRAAVSLWSADGRRILALGPAADQVPVATASELLSRAAGGAIGPFVRMGDSLAVVAMVPVGSAQHPAGYVAQWIDLGTSAAGRRHMLELIGPESGLYIGAPGTEAWTDLGGPVQPPPAAVVSADGLARYDLPGAGPRLAASAPVAGTPWRIVVDQSETLLLQPARRFVGLVIALGSGVFLVGLLGVWLLTRRITRRLRMLTDAAESINADQRLPAAPAVGDEVERLGFSFGQMAERVRQSQAGLESSIAELRATREEFARAQRMEAVGRLAGGIAHDFNNLLTAILGGTELAIRDAGPDDQEVLEDVRAAAERAAGLTRQLLAFSRPRAAASSVVDLNALVADLERMLTRLLGAHRLVTRLDAHPATVRADASQLEQVIVNLVVNARDAMARGGTILIETRSADEHVHLAVSDTGIGMTADVRDRIFEPFFTTKEYGGTGLGLATCYGIIQQSGGHIAVDTSPGIGTTMRVSLPLVRLEADAAPGADAEAPRGSETILLVEDEERVRRVAQRMLAGQGYRVLVAENGPQALEILRDTPDAIHLLLTDVVLPGMGGRELAERAGGIRPGIAVLYASGYSDDDGLQRELIAARVHFLAKPFSASALAREVRGALGDAERRTERSPGGR